MTIEQASLLDLLAHDPRRDDAYEAFVDACRSVAFGQRRYVSINAVRVRLSNDYGLTIEPRLYSSLWRRARLDGHLERTGDYELSDDRRGRNAGRMQPVYRWTGDAT